MQAKLSEQEAATVEQTACAQKLQEAVETGKGKLAESAAFMQKLQDEQTKAKQQIAEYASQVSLKSELARHLATCFFLLNSMGPPMQSCR